MNDLRLALTAARSKEHPLAEEQLKLEALQDELLDLRDELVQRTEQKTGKLGTPDPALASLEDAESKLVDLGSGIAFCRAKIKLVNHLSLAIGAGVFVEVTLEEALGIIEKRLEFCKVNLNKIIDARSDARVELVVLDETLQALAVMSG
eukprot:CAMPEP_0184541290 /NCGR_PEP_ID=MMETSP0199_2-20130426/1289_1 /TAXON_ID=1112570 /ORGANISM="Thraustochytrium sp., Strain LLF1b" /LENGTH=148 /DNA_ID=CAMNT_0026935003 /DNA_START=39 /DNA_END=485 /DNA_ORIENTATION=-